MDSDRENLIAAKALIDTPEKWGKGTGFRPPTKGLCVMGACGAVGFNGVSPLSKALGRRDVVAFNDDPETTHADIMALFDRAIAAAEARK